MDKFTELYEQLMSENSNVMSEKKYRSGAQRISMGATGRDPYKDSISNFTSSPGRGNSSRGGKYDPSQTATHNASTRAGVKKFAAAKADPYGIKKFKNDQFERVGRDSGPKDNRDFSGRRADGGYGSYTPEEVARARAAVKAGRSTAAASKAPPSGNSNKLAFKVRDGKRVPNK